MFPCFGSTTKYSSPTIGVVEIGDSGFAAEKKRVKSN